MFFVKKLLSRQKNFNADADSRSFCNNWIHRNLQPSFPQLPPVIQLLATAAEHRFLEKNQLVVHERLRMWHPNDHLGEALFQVFQDFLNFPPRIISYAVVNPTSNRTTPQPQQPQQQQPPMYQQPPPTYAMLPQQQQQQQPMYQPPQASPSPPVSSASSSSAAMNNNRLSQMDSPMMGRVTIPSQPTTFPEIEKLSNNPSEITQLLESEYQYKQWLEQLEYIKTAKQLFDELRTKNMDKAKDNIKRNKELEERTAEYNKLKEEVQQLKLSVQEKTLKQKEINERYQPQNVLKVLNQKIEQIETETEQMGDNFALNGGNWDEFMKEYMEKRSLYHLRQEKKMRFKSTYVK